MHKLHFDCFISMLLAISSAIQASGHTLPWSPEALVWKRDHLGRLLPKQRRGFVVTCNSTVQLQPQGMGDIYLMQVHDAPKVEGGGRALTAASQGDPSTMAFKWPEVLISLYGTKAHPCPPAAPIEKGQRLRLFLERGWGFISTSNLVHAPVASMDQHQQAVYSVPAPPVEVPVKDKYSIKQRLHEAPGLEWIVDWEGDNVMWLHGKTQITLKHVDTGKYLRVNNGSTWEAPDVVQGHIEVTAGDTPTPLVDMGSGWYYIHDLEDLEQRIAREEHKVSEHVVEQMVAKLAADTDRKVDKLAEQVTGLQGVIQQLLALTVAQHGGQVRKVAVSDESGSAERAEEL